MSTNKRKHIKCQFPKRDTRFSVTLQSNAAGIRITNTGAEHVSTAKQFFQTLQRKVSIA